MLSMSFLVQFDQLFFLFIMSFDWMPGIVNSTLLGAGYFCSFENIFELYSGMWSSDLETV